MKEEMSIVFPPSIDFVRFRPQRGSLADSMALVRDFEDFEQLGYFVAEDLSAFGGEVTIDDVSISLHATYDRRIGWKDTRLVCIKRQGSQIYDPPACIGYCATQFCESEVKQ